MESYSYVGRAYSMGVLDELPTERAITLQNLAGTISSVCVNDLSGLCTSWCCIDRTKNVALLQASFETSCAVRDSLCCADPHAPGIPPRARVLHPPEQATIEEEQQNTMQE